MEFKLFDIDTTNPSADGIIGSGILAKANATLNYDRDYFEANYRDWLIYRSRWQRHAKWMAFLLLSIGIAMAVSFRTQWLTGVVFSLFGIFEVYRAFTHKAKWISARLEAHKRRPGKTELTFSANEMKSQSELGSGQIELRAFEKIFNTPNGVFFIPESGYSIYVPHQSATPQNDWQQLLRYWETSVFREGSASANKKNEGTTAVP
ncbi:MAG: hypothetical protein R3C03_21030 [Pirellulaceae bacterium]